MGSLDSSLVVEVEGEHMHGAMGCSAKLRGFGVDQARLVLVDFLVVKDCLSLKSQYQQARET
jgi:hypothetical protein